MWLHLCLPIRVLTLYVARPAAVARPLVVTGRRESRLAIIDLQGINLAYGGPPLLEHIDLQLAGGERVCLVGRNGTGKSSLLRVIAEQIRADAGQIHRKPGLRVSMVQQEVPADSVGSVGELIVEGTDKPPDEETWEWQRRRDIVLAGLGLTDDAVFSELSGGLKRRVFMARALIQQPDVLLLDEPTNHLDLDAITWLERYLVGLDGALMFVTHDRTFLQTVATRIVELDRGRLTSYPGDYATYVARKQAMLAVEDTERAHFDKKLAQEEEWIRQGIKARRTRNEGRVRALFKLREERAQRRERIGAAKVTIHEADRSGKMVIEALGIAFAYGDNTIVDGLTLRVLRGDKLGLIGPNGAGKTTLLRLLLRELEPLRGEIKLGTKLEVAYLDQLKHTLRDEQTVAENIGEGADKVFVGDRSVHIVTYLRQFLFAPDRARSPVSALSGGERNRLLLAKLFARPSNLLVLDEPTNDLDTETLELLEERLMNYSGTVLVVSHDRTFIDNVVTSTLVFEGGGIVGEHVGGYSDWLRRKRAIPGSEEQGAAPKEKKKRRSQTDRPRKLTFKERRELEALPARIEALDAEQATIEEAVSNPELYKGDPKVVTKTVARLEEIQGELEEAYLRWEVLEAIDAAAGTKG